jgi:hypothetical protein
MGMEVELVEDFTDFREGYYGTPEVRILAEAIRLFMADRLKAEPAVKERYEEARRKRLGSKGSVVKLVPTGK